MPIQVDWGNPPTNFEGRACAKQETSSLWITAGVFVPTLIFPIVHKTPGLLVVWASHPEPARWPTGPARRCGGPAGGEEVCPSREAPRHLAPRQLRLRPVPACLAFRRDPLQPRPGGHNLRHKEAGETELCLGAGGAKQNKTNCT